jgi:hypothetical protein
MISGFTWPGSPGSLVVWVVQLANGSAALRVDAEVVWVTPRPASERIPTGARLLTISVHSWATRSSAPKSNRPTILRRLPSRVTSVAQIEKIVTLLNELRVHQPGRRSCLLEHAGGSAQLSFSTSPNVPPLAIADINTVDCGRGGVSLTINGMAEPELEGGWSLIEEISQALGIRPAPEKPKPHRRHQNPGWRCDHCWTRGKDGQIAYVRSTTRISGGLVGRELPPSGSEVTITSLTPCRLSGTATEPLPRLVTLKSALVGWGEAPPRLSHTS